MDLLATLPFCQPNSTTEWFQYDNTQNGYNTIDQSTSRLYQIHSNTIETECDDCDQDDKCENEYLFAWKTYRNYTIEKAMSIVIDIDIG